MKRQPTSNKGVSPPQRWSPPGEKAENAGQDKNVLPIDA